MHIFKCTLRFRRKTQYNIVQCQHFKKCTNSNINISLSHIDPFTQTTVFCYGHYLLSWCATGGLAEMVSYIAGIANLLQLRAYSLNIPNTHTPLHV